LVPKKKKIATLTAKAATPQTMTTANLRLSAASMRAASNVEAQHSSRQRRRETERGRNSIGSRKSLNSSGRNCSKSFLGRGYSLLIGWRELRKLS
jgi:hypothetical protein